MVAWQKDTGTNLRDFQTAQQEQFKQNSSTVLILIQSAE
jgi:hypothetical protein